MIHIPIFQSEKIRVWPVGDKLRFEAPKCMFIEVRDYLREHKTEVLEMLNERYEERAAILEFDAGFSRAEAERRAWEMTYGEGKTRAPA
jgi:hypothetical protein